MGTKNNPGPYDCWNNAAPDEPRFALLGRDPHAHQAVRKWAFDRISAITRGEKPETDMLMVREAQECARQMEEYSINRQSLQPRRAAAPEEREYWDGKCRLDEWAIKYLPRDTGMIPRHPWLIPTLDEWAIVGMNHYHQHGARHLFVAMIHQDDGRCIQVEGPDTADLWAELRNKAMPSYC